MGIPLLLVGIVLIPLPGPGLLVCLGALVLLAQEFEWAKAPLDKLRAKMKQAWEMAKRPNS